MKAASEPGALRRVRGLAATFATRRAILLSTPLVEYGPHRRLEMSAAALDGWSTSHMSEEVLTVKEVAGLPKLAEKTVVLHGAKG